MQVGRIMSREIASLPREGSLLEAAKLMSEKNVGCVLVLDSEERPIGIVTDRDLVVRGVAKGHDLADANVGSIMSAHPFTARRDEPIMLVARKMADKGIRRVPVVDEEGSVVGLVSVDDLLTVFISELSNVAAAIVGSSKLIS